MTRWVIVVNSCQSRVSIIIPSIRENADNDRMYRNEFENEIWMEYTMRLLVFLDVDFE